MRKRVTLLILSAVVPLLFVVPVAQAASISISSVAPPSAAESSGLVTVTVNGSFLSSPYAPQFELRGPYYTIPGTTDPDLWDASSAIVRFTIGPGVADVYDLFAQQRSGEDVWYAYTSPAAFAITSTSPHIDYIDPSSAFAGNAATTVTVYGSNFTPGSRVQWNGTGWLPTTYSGSTKISAVISEGDLVTEAYNNIRVEDGGAYSTPRQFIVTARPTPSIGSLDPVSAAAGGPGFYLTVYGSSFVSGSTGALVLWNGTQLDTIRDSMFQLRAWVPAASIATAGSASITVRNGADPGAPVSAPQSFTITGATAAPVITSLEPSSATAGGPAFSLVVHGSGFTTGASGAEVRWGTTDLPTVRDSANQLTATVTADRIAAEGTVPVTVRNGTLPGAPLSNALDFTIGSVVLPTLTSLSPTQVWAG